MKKYLNKIVHINHTDDLREFLTYFKNEGYMLIKKDNEKTPLDGLMNEKDLTKIIRKSVFVVSEKLKGIALIHRLFAHQIVYSDSEVVQYLEKDLQIKLTPEALFDYNPDHKFQMLYTPEDLEFAGTLTKVLELEKVIGPEVVDVVLESLGIEHENKTINKNNKTIC